VGPISGAPNASREVARVTAPVLRPSHGRPQAAAPQTSGLQGGVSGNGTAASAGTAVGVAGTTASKTGGRSLFRGGGGSIGGQPSGPTVGEPGKSHGKGKAKGHDKGKHHGKAKGHAKGKHHGRVAFPAPRAAKPHHVHPSRSGKHAGRGARAHARARR
jgi:hypothetical protein